jgi:hypothetical protein
VIFTVWGPLFTDFVKLSLPRGVSPTYIPSIYTEHAGGEDQIVRDPVLWVEVPVDVSGKDGVLPNVTVDFIIGVCIGITLDVLGGGMFRSVVDELFIHPQQHIKKMMNPVKIIQEFNLPKR